MAASNQKNIVRNSPIIIMILILSLLFLYSCGGEKDDSSENIGNNNSDSLVIELAGITGKSVFEITAERYDVDFVGSSMGIFIKAIDSIPSTRKFVWLFSVNDSFVTISSDDYITNDTDVIKWHYTEF